MEYVPRENVFTQKIYISNIFLPNKKGESATNIINDFCCSQIMRFLANLNIYYIDY